MALHFGYCTNVHAGIRLDEIKAALVTHALDIKRRVSPEQSLPLGLWLSQSATVEMQDKIKLETFRAWMRASGFSVSTLNGFPAGNFHQPIVKRDVYRPTWADPARLAYSNRLIELLAVLLGNSNRGTISTLPLGWCTDDFDPSFQKQCAANLLQCANHAQQHHLETGKHVRICIEPEPGCALGTSEQLFEFFERHLLNSPENRRLTDEYLGVCHDVCHAEVMWEGQGSALNRYRTSGIVVGKVQISSALVAKFAAGSDTSRQRTIERLTEFCEARYLHQTTTTNCECFYEDLPIAVSAAKRLGEWRVHFHVPIFASALGEGLHTTQPAITECLRELWSERKKIDWEVETYAWNVLPEHLRVESVSEGIAREMNWFKDLWERTQMELGD